MAKQTIVSGDTFGEGWTKQNANNTELYLEVAEKESAKGDDDNYVTDAEKVVIGNTSGTNTGDQDLSSYQVKPSEGAFEDGDKSKLDGIAAGATVDQDLSGYALTTRKLDDFGTPDDNTDLDSTTSVHGLLPKLGGGTSNFLRADGTWNEPPGGSGSVITTHIQAATDTLTAAEVSGSIINNFGQSAENTQTLPAAEAGLNIIAIIGTSGAGAFHVKAGASDKIYFDGTALDDGDKVSCATPVVGDFITLFTFQTGASAWDWIAQTGSGTWSDGGA